MENKNSLIQFLTDNTSFTMNLCRLCGEEKNPLDINIELNDKTESNWSYLELIEHHSRVVLKTNKLLPQGVCEECRAHIENFSQFSSKIQTVQSTFVAEEKEEEFIRECFVQLQPIVELYPGVDIKEQIESEDNSNDIESETEGSSTVGKPGDRNVRKKLML